MTNNNIQKLIDRYFEGKTSPTEERRLAKELLRSDIPEEWQVVRLMLGELAMGEAEYDAMMEQRTSKPSAVLIAIRIISSVAAVYLVGLFFYLQTDMPAKPTMAQNNNKMEKPQPAPQPAYCTEGTPREILTCYLERRKAQPHIYQQLKKMTYEYQ